MKQDEPNDETNFTLRLLVFQMHNAGYSQDAIAAYVGRGKQTINAMLKPLPKKKGN
jgi:hypothetical protein